MADDGKLTYSITIFGKQCREFDEDVISEVKKKEKGHLMNQYLVNSVSLILGQGDSSSGGGGGGGGGMPNMENILNKIKEEWAKRNPPPPPPNDPPNNKP